MNRYGYPHEGTTEYEQPVKELVIKLAAPYILPKRVLADGNIPQVGQVVEITTSNGERWTCIMDKATLSTERGEMSLHFVVLKESVVA